MNSFGSFFAAGLLALALTSGQAATNPPVKVAEAAHFELISRAGDLSKLVALTGNGTLTRVSAPGRVASNAVFSAEFPIRNYCWTDFAVSFTPLADGEVELLLSGPTEESSPGVVYRQEVLWDGVEAKGSTVTNGSFEEVTGNRPNGWVSEGGTANVGPMPAFAGRTYARTWHNRTLQGSLPVKANTPVTLQLLARSFPPPGYHDLRAIQHEETPAHHAAQLFRRGVNLGDSLEFPPQAGAAVKYTEEDFIYIKDEGFDHVRIPVGWHYYAGPAPDYKVADEIFEKVDRLVKNALDRHLSVILNLHHFGDFYKDPAGQTEKFSAIWRQVARHYTQYADGLVFELINEPMDKATTEVMNPIYARIAREIRAISPGRTIMVGPGDWNKIDELGKLRLPYEDDNIIVTVHCYDPFYFTHQGAGWAGPEVQMLNGIAYPGPPATPFALSASTNIANWVPRWVENYNARPAEWNPSGPQAFQSRLRMAAEWSKFYGRPIYVGEFGAITKADQQSRARFYSDFRKTSEHYDLGWAIWDWRANFKYWDDEKKTPLPGMHQALFGK